MEHGDTNRNEVARTLRDAAPHVSKLVYERTEAATAFELMDEKQQGEHLLMKKAAAFLSQQGLEIKIQWDREDPDGPLDFRGTIDGIPWAFELKQLRRDPPNPISRRDTPRIGGATNSNSKH